MKKIFTTLLLLGAAGAGFAQNFTPGNVVVARLGDGQATNNAVPVSLLEYNTLTYGNTVTVTLPYSSSSDPADIVNPSMVININPTGIEGGLSLSADGRYLVIGGSNAYKGIGDTGPSKKSFARIGYTGVPELFALDANISNGYIRSTASYDGSSIYIATNQGIAATTFPDNRTSPAIRFNNSGFINYFNVIGKHLYGVNTANPAVLLDFGLSPYDASTPHAGATSPTSTTGTALWNSGSSNIEKSYGFVLLDQDNTVNSLSDKNDVLYMADQGTSPGIVKMYYDTSTSSWVYLGRIDASGIITGLTGKINAAGKAELYAVRGATLNNELIKIIDNSSSRDKLDGTHTIVQIATSGDKYTFRSVALSPSQYSTLPLKLTSFKASSSGNNAVLKWTTSDELNVKEFVLEKSIDGKNFHSVKVVPAKNQSSNIYNLTDFNAEAKTIYYRLKMVDNDGTVTFSNIEAVSSNGLVGLTIYPNPAQDYIKVNPSLINASFEIISIDGKLLKKGVFVTDELDISFLKSGSYLLKSGGQSQRLIKK
ncbi:hypothetical protein Pedsa_2632 [Pseudopedobacter saltans DSM 12145]|uniref:Secretion system C-terminal sorting domain-containing protein n=1 Tax=Pseudopedobacter saltans (strain ATCC 51119 / DSM 12145 / JCM 21818 / CCUG 39354 / LMG 10337 / NBRC 100064 / NCIMB 13643) TaxID=762903 RepID=F0S660_PSESL|nr:T9SS type A sorting domain-containing protein [Pseudopedobacter saltans]ADY53174.1 hypothetical protein Pedsa_2632 [Pseudopedobacter saltans DSM 12145]